MRRIHLSENLRLVPVIEFEPWTYARVERESPQGSKYEEPEAWHRYWEACLSDSGIRGLEPLQRASWHVPVSRLTEAPVLRELVRATFRRAHSPVESADHINNVMPLFGGGALCDSGAVIVEPRCCCDISNLENWRVDSGYFWMGHPTLSLDREGELLILREEEAEEKGFPFPRQEWHLSATALARALSVALGEREDFAHRLEPIVSEFVAPALALPLARRLAGIRSK